ncbi:hypothetical protein [Streptomyces sp. NPDC001970]
MLNRQLNNGENQTLVLVGPEVAEDQVGDRCAVPSSAKGAVLERLALEKPQWPFKTLDGPHGFGTYWRKSGMSGGGGWQARRDCVESILGPTRGALEKMNEAIGAIDDEFVPQGPHLPAHHRHAALSDAPYGRSIFDDIDDD